MKIVLDNGGGNVKFGFNTDTTPKSINNVLGKSKKNNIVYIGDQVNDLSLSPLIIRRPHERGYLVDIEAQYEIWNYIFEKQMKIPEKFSFASTSLYCSEAPFTPQSLKSDLEQMVFELYGFGEYSSSSTSNWNYYHYATSNPESNIAKNESALIVDSGFSFTHVCPIIARGKREKNFKRVNIGGKLLSNYLREIISYRYYNMMDETQLVNLIKEEMCYSSLNYINELKNDLSMTYVLPDFINSNKGFIRDPREPKKSQDEQSLTLKDERISIPEILFNPSDIGINQAGIVEAAVQSVESLSFVFEKALMYDSILLVGGNTKFKNFQQRFQDDLQKLIPVWYNVTVHTPKDPINSCWLGGSYFSKLVFKQKITVSKQEYEEYGHTICQQRFFY